MIKNNVMYVKWGVKRGYKISVNTTYIAAKLGRIDVLKWLRLQGCPWDELTCAYAAQNGHLDVLKWAVENGCLCPEELKSNVL